MRVSSINNNQQSFSGINAHKVKRRALYGVAAACALFAGTCAFTYTKNANSGGYRSQYRTAATRPIGEKVRNFLLITSSIISMGGCFFSLKKAEDDREEERYEIFKEELEKKKKEDEFKYFEINETNSIEKKHTKKKIK